MEGTGTYFHANGNRYEGKWKNDRKEGYGKFYWKDGNRYEGNGKMIKKKVMESSIGRPGTVMMAIIMKGV